MKKVERYKVALKRVRKTTEDCKIDGWKHVEYVTNC